jgi:hypothetical protein
VSADELRLYLPPVSGFRDDGSEVRFEQQYVWRGEPRELALRWQFEGPGESYAGELPLLELTRARLAAALPAGGSVEWLGDWDRSAWSEHCPRTIAVIRPA